MADRGLGYFVVGDGVLQFRKRSQAAAPFQVFAPLPDAAMSAAAPAHAELLGEVVVGAYHPRLDSHLPRRNVELRDGAASRGEVGRGLADDESVGAGVHQHAPAFRPGARAGFGIEQRREGGGVGVTNVDELGGERRQLGKGASALQRHFLVAGEGFGRRHQQHVAALPFAEAVAGENHVQRLVPGDVAQAQRDRVRYAVGHDQVDIREVRDQLQRGARFHVPQVQRQAFAGRRLRSRALRFARGWRVRRCSRVDDTVVVACRGAACASDGLGAAGVRALDDTAAAACGGAACCSAGAGAADVWALVAASVILPPSRANRV